MWMNSCIDSVLYEETLSLSHADILESHASCIGGGQSPQSMCPLA